jgi:hypothetical protein
MRKSWLLGENSNDMENPPNQEEAVGAGGVLYTHKGHVGNNQRSK